MSDTRVRGPVVGRVADVSTDRVLRNFDERLRELASRVQSLEARAGADLVTSFLSVQLSAASDQLRIDATTPVVVIELAAPPAVLTLTSTPTITRGRLDGQLLLLRRSDAGANITFRDETAVAGTRLRLAGAANLVLTVRDVALFVWREASAEWWQATPLEAN